MYKIAFRSGGEDFLKSNRNMKNSTRRMNMKKRDIFFLSSRAIVLCQIQLRQINSVFVVGLKWLSVILILAYDSSGFARIEFSVTLSAEWRLHSMSFSETYGKGS